MWCAAYQAAHLTGSVIESGVAHTGKSGRVARSRFRQAYSSNIDTSGGSRG